MVLGKMVAKITALLMALVIANPACCCFFGCGDIEEGKPFHHSCCSGESPSGEDDSDEEKGGCNCFLKESALSETDTFLNAGRPQQSIDPPQIVSDGAETLPRVAQAVQCVSKWPPGSLPPPPMSRRLAQHGCYLL